MRVEAYLRVIGDEVTIRAISDVAQVPGATSRRLKARDDPPARDMLWCWATPRVTLDLDNIDEGLRVLLHAHKPAFPAIRKHCGPKSDIYLQMATYYEPNEEYRGLYLSAETISLLSELGAALDNDIAQVLDDRSASPMPTN
jgi:hypothetical protein